MTKDGAVHTVYLSIGSNLGQRERNIWRAVSEIEAGVGRVTRLSTLRETEPWGFSTPNKFVNAALCCLTTLSPRALLEATQAIERCMGRRTKSAGGQYADRIIDIDILLYDDISVDEPDLKIPHPLMGERAFVMIPLREIMAGDLRRGV